MIKITEKSKLYIWAPEPYVRSGGAEVLNLLASDLKKHGAEAYLWNWYREEKYPQPDYYKNLYDVNCSSKKDVIDDENTIILVPEIVLEYEENISNFLTNFPKSQLIFWWLSTSFLYNYTDVKTSKRLQFQRLKAFSNRSLHLCESEVAYRDCLYYGHENRMLFQHGINSLFYFSEKFCEKENVVFYNAFKPGTKEYVENRLIPLMPDTTFINVKFEGKDKFKGKEEMCKLFDKSKVYIDFCGFEGRELMPREACVRDCVLILGAEGNAATFEDYPIPEWYKVDVFRTNPEEICEKIRTALREYDNRLVDMQFFKNKCMFEPMKWEWELYNVFGPMIKK